jgi:hypothetical protein
MLQDISTRDLTDATAGLYYCMWLVRGVSKNDLQTDNNDNETLTTLNGDVTASSMQRTSDLASMRKALATSKNSRVSVHLVTSSSLTNQQLHKVNIVTGGVYVRHCL